MSADTTRRAARLGPQVRERGSALVLVPFAVLVIVLLAGLGVDGSLALTGQRELADLAGAAAHDAVSAIDLDAFYDEERYRIDPAAADAVARSAVAGHDDAHVRVVRVRVEVPADDTVLVTLEGVVPLVFAPAIPGTDRLATVQATASARAVRR